jgi:pimeloyl-ACP methyl ester carboxylesterase
VPTAAGTPTSAPAAAAGESVTKTVLVTNVESAQDTAPTGSEISTTAGVTGSGIERQSFTVHFSDFDAAAELTYPSKGEGPFPTLILIAGSGIEDMDASICSFGSPEPLSQNFRRLAEELPNHGIAVLRYNKHYVTGPCQADFMQYYSNVDLPLLLEDAGLVLAAAQSNELVDSDEIYLYGWSEGSTVAAQLAISNSGSIAGLVLQAPVVLPWYDTFLYQFANVQLPYLRDLAPDSQIVSPTLLSLVQGNAGLVALGGLTYLADPQVMAQNQLALNPFFDADESGAIDIEAELLPNLRAYLDQLFTEGGPFAIYRPERALPTVGEHAAELQLPLLILQGENDANVPAFGAQLLDVLLVGNPNRTLLQYEGLGHSLGEASSVVADNFAPMADRPVEDLAAWLAEQVER